MNSKRKKVRPDTDTRAINLFRKIHKPRPPPVTPPVNPDQQTKTQDNGTPIPPPPVETTKTPASNTPPQTKDYPYGTSVPNKPGFVTSPHAPYAGYVDVRGIPTGTPVKDPYTGKIFLVP